MLLFAKKENGVLCVNFNIEQFLGKISKINMFFNSHGIGNDKYKTLEKVIINDNFKISYNFLKNIEVENFHHSEAALFKIRVEVSYILNGSEEKHFSGSFSIPALRKETFNDIFRNISFEILDNTSDFVKENILELIKNYSKTFLVEFSFFLDDYFKTAKKVFSGGNLSFHYFELENANNLNSNIPYFKISIVENAYKFNFLYDKEKEFVIDFSGEIFNMENGFHFQFLNRKDFSKDKHIIFKNYPIENFPPNIRTSILLGTSKF